MPVLLRLDFGEEPGKADKNKAVPSTAKNGAKPVKTPPGSPLKPGDVSKPEATPIEANPPGKKSPTEAKASGEDDGDENSSAADAKDLPPAVLADWKAKYQEKVACAAVLAKAGVLFAFSTGGLESPDKFAPALLQVVNAGLPKEKALQALSLNAARIFGVDRQMGTIAPGKIAAVIVTDGDFTATKTKVKYVFIDNTKFEPGKDKPDAPDANFDFGGHE